MIDVLGGHIDGCVPESPVLSNRKDREAAGARNYRRSTLQRIASSADRPGTGVAGFGGGELVCDRCTAACHASITTALHAAIVKSVALPAVSDKLLAAGVDPKTDASAAAFAQFVHEEFDRWGKG
jgi:hypothetical protein